MKPIRMLWCVAVAALVVGCQDNPTDPAAQADEVTTPVFQAERTDLIREFIWDWEDFIPCANDRRLVTCGWWTKTRVSGMPVGTTKENSRTSTRITSSSL